MSKRGVFFVLVFVVAFLVAPRVEAGKILNDYKYAWSNNAGYINFADVVVEDQRLTGYAWSKNRGWINFSPATGGVLNDGKGNLSGYAWGSTLGWINFEGVSIDPATGKFSGKATGNLIGTLTFDCPTYCDVRTDWRRSCPAVENAETYNAYPTCGPATCKSGYEVLDGACVTKEKRQIAQAKQTDESNQSESESSGVFEVDTPETLLTKAIDLIKDSLNRRSGYIWWILLLVLLIVFWKRRKKREEKE